MSPTFRVVAISLALLLARSVAVAAPRTAFVTSSQGSGDLSTWLETSQDGLAGGDEICRSLAGDAGLANAGTYRAWLSTATTDAWCHLFGLTGTKASGCGGANPDPWQMGPWVRVDGTPFAGSLGALAGAARLVYQPLRLDENGAAVPDVDFWAWTGTDADGEAHVDTCNDWSTASAADYGLVGIAWNVGPEWTLGEMLNCSGSTNGFRLLCLEPGPGDPIRYPWAAGALAFLTSVKGDGDLSGWADAGGETGIGAADEICQARAAAGFLPNPGSFFAWISDGATNAADRLDTPGAIVRVDGIELAASESDLLSTSADLGTGLNVTELETYSSDSFSSAYVWTGTDYSGNARADTCDDWASNDSLDLGGIGASTKARYTWTVNGSGHCQQLHALYCFSNVEVLFWDHFERGDTGRWSATVQ